MSCGGFVKKDYDCVSLRHVVYARQLAFLAPVACCESKNTRYKATFLVTWRGPTLRPRGPPLTQHLGKGGRDHPTVSPRDHGTGSSVCLCCRVNRNQTQKGGRGRQETNSEGRSLSRFYESPKQPEGLRETCSPERKQEAGELKLPATRCLNEPKKIAEEAS